MISQMVLAGRSRPKARCVFINAGLTSFLVLLGGCVQGKPTIGPIQFVNAQGASILPVASLPVSVQLYLFATVANDDELLGVSWTVTCGSAIPSGDTSVDTSCGTFNPAQTASGPIPLYPSTDIITTYSAPSAVPKGGTVTITAHATALPSVTSSLTLTILTAQAVAEPSSMGKRQLSQARRAGLGNAFPIADFPGRALSGGL